MPLLAVGAGAAGVVVLVVMIGTVGVLIPTAAAPAGAACPDPSGNPPGKAALADIPPGYLSLYRAAGAAYGIPWSVLAAIGDAESDHGRGTGPGIRSGTNQVGAAGPMQFMPGTWEGYGVDGSHDGHKNVYDPADAIPAAARLLKTNRAPAHLERAVYAYNHSHPYVKWVLARAAEYGRAGGVQEGACTQVPIAAAGRAAVAIRAALKWVGTPYSWGGGSTSGPTLGIGRGAHTVGFDCSSLTRYAWHQAGISIPRTSQEQWRALPHVPAAASAPGDLVFFKGAYGAPNAPGHVALNLGAGRMVEAPRTGLNIRVASTRTRSDLIGYARPTPSR